MRLVLTLRGIARQEFLPINYNSSLNAWFYHLLYEASPEYAGFLHNHGYPGADGKLRKLYTFSRLQIQPRATVDHATLIITPQHRVSLVLSSPMTDDFIQNLVIGLFQKQQVEIANQHTVARFTVQTVEALPPLPPVSSLACRALSPIVVAAGRDKDGKPEKHYMRPHEPELSDMIRQSLIKKYQTVYGTLPADDSLTFTPDPHTLSRNDPEKLMTLVKLKEGKTDQTNVKGFLCPFTLAGSPDLIRTAWDCGIGDQTSMGFGCVGEDK